MRKKIVGIGAAVAILAALFAGYWFFLRTPTNAPDTIAFDLSATSASVATSSASRSPYTPPPGYVEYRNTTYDFSLFYPQELAVKTYDEGEGASTIVFQNVGKVEGFQIFIVPYNGAQVSEERFTEDEPSGVRQNVTVALVDGATAAVFYGNDLRLGDTYEVWFIHDGYLYEVSTLKTSDTWLQGIMQGWQFL